MKMVMESVPQVLLRDAFLRFLFVLCCLSSLLVHGVFVMFYGLFWQLPEPVLTEEDVRPFSFQLSLATPQETTTVQKESDEVEQQQDVETPLEQSVSSPRENRQALENYMTTVYEAIDREKVYPRVALRRYLESDIILRVTLNRAGAVVKIDVEEGTETLFIDAAKRAVLAAAPFPSFPPMWEKPTVTIRVPMIYRLSSDGF